MQVKIEAESPTMILWKRTRVILDKLASLKINVLHAAENLFLEELGKKTAQSGFHDLYLKCQFYQTLLDNIDDNTYLSLLPSNKVLIELLFNPSLEDSLLDIHEKENLSELMADYKEISKIINTEHDIDIREASGCNIINLVSFDDKNLPFTSLRKSIKQYLEWYDKNSQQLYDSKSPMIASVDSSEEQYFYELHANSDHYVEQGYDKEIELTDGQSLGTSSLGPCLAMIALASKPDHTRLYLKHDSDSFDKSITAVCNDFKKQGYQVSIYLLGGLAQNLCEYIDLVVDGNYPIKDICLLTPDTKALACVCYYQNNIPAIRFSYKAAHNYVFANQNEDSSSIEEEIIPKLPATPTLRRSGAVFFQPETDSPEEGPIAKKTKFDLM